MQMYGVTDELSVMKWKPILEAENASMAPIKDFDTQMGVARMLESAKSYMEATPSTVAGGIAGYDNVMLSLIRRVGPTILGNQLVGVQPMNGPTGLVFALRPRYNGAAGAEIHGGAPNTTFTGFDSAGAAGASPATITTDVETDPFAAGGFTVSQWVDTANLEGDINNELSATIDSIPVAARGRRLKVNYSQEMVQDLAFQHKVDANAMFGSLMSQQLGAEINYESLRLMYFNAILGAQDTATPGTYDLVADTDARWIGERGKVLMMRIEHEASIIMQETRMGAGTFVVCDSKTYNLLSNSGFITPAGPSNNMFSGSDPVVRDSTVAMGRLPSGLTVYRDDYARTANGEGFCLVGWRGVGPAEAASFYTPYVLSYSATATDPASGQPIRFLKTRAGRATNPIAGTNGAFTARSNPLLRIFKVTNINL